MNISRFFLFQLFFFTLIKFNFLTAAEPLPFNNIVLHKNPLQVSQVKFKDFDSKDIVLNKNDGKIKILNFWATWCAPCKKEMPSLDKFSLNNQDFLVFPINLEKINKEKTLKFYEDLNIENLKIFFDPEFILAKQFKLRGVPTTVFINKKGQEFARVLGDIDFNDKNFIKWLNNYK
tara:strand:+ start:30 stop:557 length:528 start_codon:yes stop_codon:yes gene_type:complete